jgi:hypothetical protein
VAIHYGDYSGLSQVVPADGDHFDKAQAVIFTRALADVLIQLSLAPGPEARQMFVHDPHGNMIEFIRLPSD